MNVFSTATKFAFFITAIAALLHMAWWYGKLPDIVPSHFDLQGNPDDTMEKSSYMVVMVAVHLFLVAFFGLISYLMPKSPASLFNIPNKEYWLEPERRDTTVREMQCLLMGIATLTMIFLGVLFHLSSQVAVKQRATISPEFMWLLGVYLAATIGIAIWSLWKYRMPADAIE